MSDKFFLDTNILIYAFEPAASEKQRRAKELVERALTTKEGCVSVQVAQEFLNVAIRKWQNRLSASDGRIFIERILQPLCVEPPSLSLLKDALRLHEDTGYDFYDSLILASAIEARCDILYSEDFHSGHNVQKLRIVNPFQPKT